MTAPTPIAPPRLRLFRSLATALDFNDRFFFAGLLLVGVGGAMLSIAWTLVTIGAVLALVGLFGSR